MEREREREKEGGREERNKRKEQKVNDPKYVIITAIDEADCP